VVLFDNNISAAVSTKVYKTKRGAENANARLADMCGDGYSKMDIPWNSTDPATGEVTTNYRRENLIPIK
tara:strand:+ start:231 stop:437 length:207 start_codon:yes stop_codon:yes gene_type:complete